MRRVVLNRRDFIELSESVLGQHGCLRFEARGSSMYPFIRSGDVLTVQPTEAADLNVGDVAFYRAAQDSLVAHRVVRKYMRDGQVTLIMRGDTVPGPGEQIQATQVLGQVVSVQQGWKITRTDRGFRRLVTLLWTNLQLLGGEGRKAGQPESGLSGFLVFRRIASRLLCCVQRIRLYRFLARKLIRKHVCYRDAQVEDAYDCSRFYGYNRFSELDNPMDAFACQLENLEGYGYILVADIDGRIAGAVVIKHFPDNTVLYSGWWLIGLLVRACYRGAGIGEELVRAALQKATSEGAASVNLMVSRHNRAAINLYRKIGFRQTSISTPDGQLNQDVRETEHQRIIMSLNVSMRNDGALSGGILQCASAI